MVIARARGGAEEERGRGESCRERDGGGRENEREGDGDRMSALGNLLAPEDVDIVIPTIRNLDFLEQWR